MATTDPATTQRTEGPTPTGGAYAIGFFHDAAGNPCPRASAASVEIFEYDAKDQVIQRTYMALAGQDDALSK
jgi:hypothetical protein